MKWYRLYTEARTDAKLRTLSDAEHRVWFNLLCLAAEGEDDARGTIADRGDVWLAAEVAHGNAGLLDRTLTKLAALHIIARNEEAVTFKNFDRRQYRHPSDAPERVKERVKRHRNGTGSKETRMKRRVTTPRDQTTDHRSRGQRLAG